jgi:hypothetical protein
MKACGAGWPKAWSKRSDHHLVDAAAFAARQLVAQRAMRAGACSGLPAQRGEVVARVRLEGQHAGRQAAVAGLVGQQGQHGLVAAVHAVEVADGQRAGRHQRQPQLLFARGLAGCRSDWPRVVVQCHAGKQLLQLSGLDRARRAGLVDLGHVVLGRGEAVQQRAVVRKQQQARGVLVEPGPRAAGRAFAAAAATGASRWARPRASASIHSPQACAASPAP